MFEISITDQHERIATITSLCVEPVSMASIPYKNRLESFPVIRVPIELPIYRVRNGRIMVEELEYIHQRQLDSNYFKNGQENVSVQKVLHDILFKISRDAKGPIYQELEQVKLQKESLIVTHNGVVINGNRRLAAMRELYHDDPNKFASFSYIDVLVLPSTATETDIEMLEIELQLAPNTKLDYSWINRRLNMREQINDLGFTRDQIKAAYRFTREEEINTELQQLALAEEYLETYLRSPYAYKEVSHSEQNFMDLQKALSGKSGEESEVRRLMGFLIVKESGNLGGRAYGYKDLYGKDFEKVVQKFAEEEGIQLNIEQNTTNEEPDEEENIWNVLYVEPQIPYTPIKEILSDLSKANETAVKLVDILDSVRRGGTEDKKKQDALKKAEAVLKMLSQIDITTSDPKTHTQILGQLKGAVNLANNIISQLSVS